MGWRPPKVCGVRAEPCLFFPLQLIHRENETPLPSCSAPHTCAAGALRSVLGRPCLGPERWVRGLRDIPHSTSGETSPLLPHRPLTVPCAEAVLSQLDHCHRTLVICFKSHAWITFEHLGTSCTSSSNLKLNFKHYSYQVTEITSQTVSV